MSTKRIIRIRRVMDRTGLARSTIYAKIAAGEFPKPIQLGPRSVGWDEEVVDKWIRQRIEESRNNCNA